MHCFRTLCTAVFLIAFASISYSEEKPKRPITVEDLFKLKRVSDPQISPDGNKVVYVVSAVSLKENTINSDLWLAATDGSWRKQITFSPKSDNHPRWSPDGQRILFVSSRSGTSQLWLLDLTGGEARQITDIATGASDGIWARDGKHVAFVSAVRPEFSAKPYAEANALNKKWLEEKENSPVKARVFTKLFFRHWDHYVEGKRQHLFVKNLEGGDPLNVTPGDRDAYPTSMTFAVGDDYTFSPDSKYLVYTAPPHENEAWSTNYDIWRVPTTGGKPENLTKDNKAGDDCPRFSPDGKYFAYRAQRVPGSEADKWELWVSPANGNAVPKSVSEHIDLSIGEFHFVDNNTLYSVAERIGRTAIIYNDLKKGTYVLSDRAGSLGSLSVSHDSGKMAYTHSALDHPARAVVSSIEPSTKKPSRTQTFVDKANAVKLKALTLPRPESEMIPGADNTPMQMWILKPPGFDPNKKYPLVYLVHGGPQGAWSDGWSWRWNPQIWAAQGYVIAMPNPRGSTGFGQKYTNEITGDWGGKCFEDLMKGVEYLEKQPFVDSDRMAAAGASFGGYMMNWFLGRTDKFKTLINHCGVYNHESMYGVTEELWFDEWEHGQGKPLWENRKEYLKHSPHLHAAKFKTPMLVIHNDLDFRVPIGEGLQLFTTLQRLGVPSKMINFPDEGHWVLKPQNSAFWHREIFKWLKEYVPPGGR